MAKYLTSGWEHYAFVVTPRELEEILQDMHLLIVTRHVPKGYRETPLSDFVADFSGIYEKLRTGRQVTSREVWTYPQFGVASALEKYGYGRPHIFRGEEYLRQDFEEPCAMIGRFPIHLLRDRIKAITKPLRVCMEDGEVRPRVRISQAALEDVENFWFFRNHPVRVVK